MMIFCLHHRQWLLIQITTVTKEWDALIYQNKNTKKHSLHKFDKTRNICYNLNRLMAHYSSQLIR